MSFSDKPRLAVRQPSLPRRGAPGEDLVDPRPDPQARLAISGLEMEWRLAVRPQMSSTALPLCSGGCLPG